MVNKSGSQNILECCRLPFGDRLNPGVWNSFVTRQKKEKRSQHLAITEKQLTLSLNRMDYSTGRRIFFAANWKCGFSSVPPFSYGSYSRQREALNKEDRRKWMMNWSAGLWCEEVAWFTWSEVLLQICQPKKKKNCLCICGRYTEKRKLFRRKTDPWATRGHRGGPSKIRHPPLTSHHPRNYVSLFWSSWIKAVKGRRQK